MTRYRNQVMIKISMQGNNNYSYTINIIYQCTTRNTIQSERGHLHQSLYLKIVFVTILA